MYPSNSFSNGRSTVRKYSSMNGYKCLSNRFTYLLLTTTLLLVLLQLLAPAQGFGITSSGFRSNTCTANPIKSRSFYMNTRFNYLQLVSYTRTHSRQQSHSSYNRHHHINSIIRMFSSSSDVKSVSDISHSLAHQLINGKDNGSGDRIIKPKLSLAIAGGGSSAISTITSTNNASSIFIKSQILYDRTSFANYISSSLLSTKTNNNECSNIITNHPLFKCYQNERNHLFGYCTSFASFLLSWTSLSSTLRYTTTTSSSTSTSESSKLSFETYQHLLGIGCTSALVSKGKEERQSKVFISIMNGLGSCTSYDIKLDNTTGTGTASLKNKTKMMKMTLNRRNRMEEEEIVGTLLLWCINHYISTQNDDHNNNDCSKSNDNNNIVIKENQNEKLLEQILNRENDSLQINQYQMMMDTRNTNTATDTSHDSTSHENHTMKDDQDEKYKHVITNAANYVIHGTFNTPSSTSTSPMSKENNIIMLIPNTNNSINNYKSQLVPTVQAIIPSYDPIIFPGSFNPIHVGHIALANAAIRTMSRKKKEEMISFHNTIQEQSIQKHTNDNDAFDNMMEDLWNTTEYLSLMDMLDNNTQEEEEEICPLLFEMSLTNPDKPSMEPKEVLRRTEIFNEQTMMQTPTKTDDDDDKDHTTNFMPKEWGLLLTSAPLFIDKVRLFNQYLSPSGAMYSGNNYGTRNTKRRLRKMSFVIGTDTMIRIINPKYYGDNYDSMLEAVREMGDLGAHFVVGGRVEQTKDLSMKDDAEVEDKRKFVTGEEELVALPKDVRDMFTIIKEEDFRVDISSSEIRAKQGIKI
mmetsp:Transcript_10286/g.13021  ORF Transcript_10286/g.13021 Transcript_10286/m.13021 type:complete len:804 (+) Transcript_10286:94-2505(+)